MNDLAIWLFGSEFLQGAFVATLAFSLNSMMQERRCRPESEKRE